MIVCSKSKNTSGLSYSLLFLDHFDLIGYRLPKAGLSLVLLSEQANASLPLKYGDNFSVMADGYHIGNIAHTQYCQMR